MTPKFTLFTLAAVLLASPALHAAGGGNLEQEYQVTKAIALRDPKVKAAYAEADRKLQAKIVQIDPALANYQPHRAGEPEAAASTPKPAEYAKPTATTGGFHSPHAATATASAVKTTHTVAKGETLGGIASHYGVTVAALKTANHIADEKKLSVGQVLTIPGASSAKKQ
jgi:LysM repeat protein